MAMRREVRCIYCAIFKTPGIQLDIREIVSFYNDYNEFRKKILENEAAPSTIKTQLVPIKVPQYIEWVKQYLVMEKG